MGHVKLNIKIGRQAMAHRINKDGVMAPYIRGYDLFYSARDVDEPDWPAINKLLEADYNSTNVELCFHFFVDVTNENQKQD